MPIRQRLIEDDRDELNEELDDLDQAYLKTLEEAGVDSDLLEQFRDLSIESKQQ